jgi:hypothetical protein
MGVHRRVRINRRESITLIDLAAVGIDEDVAYELITICRTVAHTNLNQRAHVPIRYVGTDLSQLPEPDLHERWLSGYGVCATDPSGNYIWVSEDQPLTEARDTLIHETCHGLCHARAGHTEVWRRLYLMAWACCHPEASYAELYLRAHLAVEIYTSPRRSGFFSRAGGGRHWLRRESKAEYDERVDQEAKKLATASIEMRRRLQWAMRPETIWRDS